MEEFSNLVKQLLELKLKRLDDDKMELEELFSYVHEIRIEMLFQLTGNEEIYKDYHEGRLGVTNIRNLPDNITSILKKYKVTKDVENITKEIINHTINIGIN